MKMKQRGAAGRGLPVPSGHGAVPSQTQQLPSPTSSSASWRGFPLSPMDGLCLGLQPAAGHYHLQGRLSLLTS